MEQIFKAGDKVYCPMLGNKIYKLTVNWDKTYPLRIISPKNTYCFTKEGKYAEKHENISLFNINKENQELLSKLYGVYFEEPKSFLDHHLSLGSKVLCLVCEETEHTLPNKIWKLNKRTQFIDVICEKISENQYLNNRNWNIISKHIYPISINNKGNIEYLK